MKAFRLALMSATVAMLAGCDNGNSTPTGGGTVSIDAPKSTLGKAVKSAKDTRDAISRGGNSREAAVVSAKIRVEQLREIVLAMKGRGQSQAATEAIETAEARVERAGELAEKFESSSAPDDGSETKQLRDAVKEAEDAVAKAKEKL